MSGTRAIVPGVLLPETGPSGVCSREGCGKPVKCRGLCITHYVAYWRQHMDTKRAHVPADIVKQLREISPEAILALINAVMRSQDENATYQEVAIGVKASEIVLNRAWGAPVQRVELKLEDMPLEEISAAIARVRARIAARELDNGRGSQATGEAGRGGSDGEGGEEDGDGE